MLAQSDLETQSSSAYSSFQVLGISRDSLLAGHLYPSSSAEKRVQEGGVTHFLHIFIERSVLPSENVDVGVRLRVGGNLAMENLEVHRSFAGAELKGDLPHFLHHLHRQRARECKGDCNEKKRSRSVDTSRDKDVKRTYGKRGGKRR